MSALIKPPSLVGIEEDPLAKMVRELRGHINGDLPDFKIWNNNILVFKFIRTHHSKNIVAAAETQREDMWQGKVGMVIKMGPSAFVDDASLGIKFYGQKVQPGDWVMYRSSDGIDWDYLPPNVPVRIHFRILTDAHIQMTVPRPDVIL